MRGQLAGQDAATNVNGADPSAPGGIIEMAPALSRAGATMLPYGEDFGSGSLAGA
jgi:hypothetical protein